jgi:hypothetical protein
MSLGEVPRARETEVVDRDAVRCGDPVELITYRSSIRSTAT